MHVRYVIASAMGIAVVAILGCLAPADDMGMPEGAYECPERCPAGYVAVQHCPAFTDCREYPGCDEFEVCAPREAVEDRDDDSMGPGVVDCDEQARCPAGSVEVDDCPPGEVCTAISVCDEDLLCREAPELCSEQPRCADDARPVEHCEGLENDYCDLHHHCSGPVFCLECHDGLPDGCDKEATRIDDPQECEADDIECERVETCEETLWCATHCIPDAECPQVLMPVEECGEDGLDCIELNGCDGSLRCEAPEETCDEAPGPECGEGYEEVDVETCLDEFDDCRLETACGEIAACIWEE